MQNWQENIPMTKDKFWEVIDNARAIAPALEGEPLRESLYKQLLTLSPDELVGFDCAWQEYRRIANSPQLIAAACIINGGTSDDRFDYFKNWLILQGQYVFRQVLKDPDALAEFKIPFDDTEWEDCGYLTSLAFVGRALPTYAVAVIVAVTDQKNTRPGAEHGSAAWGDVFRLNKFYMDRHGSNLLLTQHFHIGIDGYKHKHNTNILIVGGSGAGKTRTYGVPNVLECACSMVITDPKAEILRKTGNLLKQKGYEVIVFDLINPAASFCYNPFVYVHDDREVLTLIENLIQNTTPSHSKSSDPFWEKSETALLQALMLYLLHEAPPEEQNFSMVMEMIAAAEVHEDDDNFQSPLDILFERLEMREPDSIACKQYRIFKQAAGKTAKSILVSVGVRLAAFNLPSIAKLTMTDELHLQELGERKIALFCCIPDSDKSLNYLVGMIYTQLIQTLYRQADRVHKGRLPMPVHCLMDEYANLSLPKDTFLSALATMRSRGIFCSIIVQNMAQLKAMYKDDWESLVGLCDEFLYLGGTEKETHKYVSELLGKETISTTSYNQSKGRSGSYSINHQQSGRDLMTPDEVRLLDNSKCILFIRGERPVIDLKYNLLKHPNIRCTEDGGAAPYDYTAADNALDDLPGAPENYELLDMDDFLPAEAVEMKPTIQRIRRPK
jgi:type IV secretory pathway TraG/TraD family ATPase VirD4